MNPTYPSSSSTTSADAGAARFAAGSSGTEDMLQDTSRESSIDTSRDQSTSASLRTELGNLKSDLDTLLARATNLSDAELRQEYARMMTKFSALRTSAKNVAAEANRQLNRGMDATSGYVREKPLQSVAVATGVGVMLGMLFNRH